MPKLISVETIMTACHYLPRDLKIKNYKQMYTIANWTIQSITMSMKSKYTHNTHFTSGFMLECFVMINACDSIQVNDLTILGCYLTSHAHTIYSSLGP